ncbi:MAG TPA: Mur ligase family protein [Candidatus Limnocylindrales bacterium]|nr:Mur ligase family protein [Candidatus Limnocylindrales bacterium]
MRYQDTLARLRQRGRFGIRLGLGRTRALLRRMGDPQAGLPGALIGGTNGKGSTQAMLASVLKHGGYRVGQTPKPHLVSYRERIVVDGSHIPINDFCDLIDEVLAQADHVEGRHGPPTEFEVITAAAFTYFRRAKVDLAVVEVGMGGRLDATNVWSGGASAITNVGLDHMEYLGSTVEAIAREKAAIIKRGDAWAVTGAGHPALSVIWGRARRVHVPLVETSAPAQRIALGLLGAHQQANAAVAVGVLDGLDRMGFPTTAAVRAAGLAKAEWPGRLEHINVRGVDVLLDGAHNPDGMRALAAALGELLPQLGSGEITLLIGILENHWQEGMLDPLNSAAPGALLVATEVPDAPNSLPLARIDTAWAGRARRIEDTDKALEAALATARDAGATLLVCGSLYLVGYVRAQLVGE